MQQLLVQRRPLQSQGLCHWEGNRSRKPLKTLCSYYWNQGCCMGWWLWNKENSTLCSHTRTNTPQNGTVLVIQHKISNTQRKTARDNHNTHLLCSWLCEDSLSLPMWLKLHPMLCTLPWAGCELLAFCFSVLSWGGFLRNTQRTRFPTEKNGELWVFVKTEGPTFGWHSLKKHRCLANPRLAKRG